MILVGENLCSLVRGWFTFPPVVAFEEADGDPGCKQGPVQTLSRAMDGIRSKKRRQPESQQPRMTTSKEDFYHTAAKWNLEQDYEARPRKKQRKGKESNRLPIKTWDGRVERLEVPMSVEDDHSSVSSLVQDDNPVIHENTHVEVARPSRQQVLEAKEELARVATLISEDPEEHEGAFKIMTQISQSSSPTIQKLGIVTQLAVYQDVIPGYRIRPIAEANVAEKLSKEVRKIRTFEQTLLTSYRTFVGLLERLSKFSHEHTDDGRGLRVVAISCACTLLLAVPHFNFRSDLLRIIVDALRRPRSDPNFTRCRETLELLFQEDEDGTASLDAVSMLTKMMRARNYHVDESLLNTFLHLRLLSEFSSKASQNGTERSIQDNGIKRKILKPKREFRTKRRRKDLKELKAVEKEFEVADAIVGREERDRMQGETLKLVFITYFRILKTRSASLAGAVLEGLAKYAHLINQDFFGDLLEVLKELVSRSAVPNDSIEHDQANADPQSAGTVNHRHSLLCCVTAFALLEGQDVAKAADSLHLDLTFFTAHLYRSLHALAMIPDLELSSKSLRLTDPEDLVAASKSSSPKVNVRTTSALLLRCLSASLMPRNVSPVRLAAFTHRLMEITMHLPERSAVGILALLVQVSKVQGRKITSLWNSEERRGDGTFTAEAANVEASNPFAGTMWSGEILRLHYAARVKDGLQDLESSIMAFTGR